MSLQATLNEMKEKFEAGLPPEIKTLMHKATADLAGSGILDKVLKKGTQMKHFNLQDEQGNDVKSQQLLDRGNLVATFYRGVW